MKTNMKYDEMLLQIHDQIRRLEQYIKECKESRLSAQQETAEKRVEALKLSVYCLKQYIDPWSCPICGFQTKIPHDHQNKRNCPKCLNKHMFPYGYLEQERMSNQMTPLLACAQHYKDQPNGSMALQTLKILAEVGRYKPK